MNDSELWGSLQEWMNENVSLCVATRARPDSSSGRRPVEPQTTGCSAETRQTGFIWNKRRARSGQTCTHFKTQQNIPVLTDSVRASFTKRANRRWFSANGESRSLHWILISRLVKRAKLRTSAAKISQSLTSAAEEKKKRSHSKLNTAALLLHAHVTWLKHTTYCGARTEYTEAKTGSWGRRHTSWRRPKPSRPGLKLWRERLPRAEGRRRRAERFLMLPAKDGVWAGEERENKIKQETFCFSAE